MAKERPRTLNMDRLRGRVEEYPIFARSASAASLTECLRPLPATDDKRRVTVSMMVGEYVLNRWRSPSMAPGLHCERPE